MDPPERMGCQNTELLEGKMMETPSSTIISTKQQQIAELAGKMPEKALSSLAHHMDLDWMMEAYRRTRKGGAVGIDGCTSADYSEYLEENLQSVLNRAKSGARYRAPPVRRVYIPRGDGSERPLGIPSLADIARLRNPLLRGWLEYYGKFCRSAMYPVLPHFNMTLRARAMKK